MKNLFKESLYLQGARDLLLVLMEICVDIDFAGKDTKQKQVYNKAIIDFLLSDRMNMRRFLEREPFRFYDHKTDNKGKLTSVKVCFEIDYKRIKNHNNDNRD